MSRVTTHPKVTSFRPPETGEFAFTEASRRITRQAR